MTEDTWTVKHSTLLQIILIVLVVFVLMSAVMVVWGNSSGQAAGYRQRCEQVCSSEKAKAVVDTDGQKMVSWNCVCLPLVK